jgi:hypothetical protein
MPNVAIAAVVGSVFHHAFQNGPVVFINEFINLGAETSWEII